MIVETIKNAVRSYRYAASTNSKATSIDVLLGVDPGPSFLASWTDAEILAKYPAIPWRTPLPLENRNTGKTQYMCELCSLRDLQKCEKFSTPADVLEHVAAVHFVLPD